MNKHVFKRHSWSAIAAVALVLPVTSALAAKDTPRLDYQGAGGVCQPTAAQYEAGLRSRPLGLANEGTTTAFVSCALQGNDVAAGRLITQVDVLVKNSSTGQSVSCTLVAATQAGSAFYSVGRPITPRDAPNALQFSWYPNDPAIDGGTKIGIPRPSLICTLPPAAVLQYTALYYREGIDN